MVSAHCRRREVEYARKRGLSCRRACALVQVARSSLRYESRLAKKDAPVRARMCELAAQYPRYGYRRIRIFLGRDGHKMGPDRAHRLWRQAGLQVPRRRPRRRVAASRPRPLPPTGPNHVWAYDFVFDTSATASRSSASRSSTTGRGRRWPSTLRAAFAPKESSRCSGGS